MESKKLHANYAQLRVLAILSRITICVMGRGTGKTDFITAPWIAGNVFAMPRSVGGLIIPNYSNYQKIFSEIKKGLEKIGLRENLHFVINRQPPKAWGAKGYNAPSTDFKNYISFYNGSGFYILSSNTGHNGANLDWLAVEEAKLIPDVFFRETYLAVRGANIDLFGDLSNFGSLLVVTDRPRQGEYDWFYSYEKEYLNEDNLLLIELIKAIGLKIKKLEKQVTTNVVLTDAYLLNKIANLKAELNFFRRKAINYVEASSLENIHVLGTEKIVEWAKTLSSYDMAVSVMNLKPNQAEHRFYDFFDTKKHAYYAENDILPNIPLHIAFDYNSAICCLEVVQVVNNVCKVVRSFDSADGLESLCNQFISYFKPLINNKLVYYYYDHTAKQGRGANNRIAYHETVEHFLRTHFYLVPKYIGYASLHDDRRSLYSKKAK